LVDTHCHLNFHSFKKDYAQIAQAAFDAGVTKIINVGAKLDSSRRAVKIAKEIPYCFATVGIHPHHAEEFPDLSIAERELSTIIEEDKNGDKKIVAIGECGLDYHEYLKGEKHIVIDGKNKDKQKKLLELHLVLAKKYHLPLILHCRDAYSDLLNLLRTTYYQPASPARLDSAKRAGGCENPSLQAKRKATKIPVSPVSASKSRKILCTG